MSRATTVEYRDRQFWALDDAFAVWFAYLVDEIDRGEQAGSPLQVLSAQWRTAAAITDYGATVALPDQGGERDVLVSRLLAIAGVARSNAEARGDLTREEVARWLILDDLPVAGGFLRTGDVIAAGRVLEVADGFIALLSGSLPDDPPEGAWFLGTGQGYQVMPLASGT